MNKKQKRVVDQYQSQHGESLDPGLAAEWENPNNKTEEEPETFIADPSHPERTLRIG